MFTGKPQSTSRETNLGILKLAGRALIKPVTTFNNYLGQYSRPKKAIALVLSSVAFRSLIGLVVAVIKIVRPECLVLSGSTRSCSVNWSWGDVVSFDYIGAFLLDFLLNVIMVFVASGVFYFVGKLFKDKRVNFWRMLAVSSVICFVTPISMLVVNLLPLLFIPSAIRMMIDTIVGLYILYMFMYGINTQVSLDGDKRFYYNFLCIVVPVAVFYIAAMFI